MQWIHLRPTFEILLVGTRESAIEQLRAECAQTGQANRFSMYGEYGEIHLPSEEHRLWSPQLSFSLSAQENQCLIHGRYSPRINVWTFVWIVYLAMAFTAFFALILAYSQWMLGRSLWGLWVALVAFFAILALYIVAYIGQQLSADQMHSLRVQFDETLARAGIQKAN